jgi:hypothetical protein
VKELQNQNNNHTSLAFALSNQYADLAKRVAQLEEKDKAL